MQGNEDLFKPKNDSNNDLFRPKQGSIYKKGGIYEQFGPEGRVYNPIQDIQFGPFAPSATQPGQAMPIAGQSLGNVVGGFAGPFASGVSGVVGALTGEKIRQKIGDKYGVQDDTKGKQLENVFNTSALSELIPYVGSKAIKYGKQFLSGPAEKSAEKLMYNYLRPSKKLAKKSPSIAKDALEIGVRGSHEKALGQVESYIGQNMDDVNKIIETHGDKRAGIKKAYQYLDEKIYQAFQEQDPAKVSSLTKLKETLQDGFVDDALYIGEDNQMYSGKQLRPTTVSELQDMKQAQYRNLKDRKVGGGYGSDTNSTEIIGRQEYARGLKDDIIDAVQDPNLDLKNKQVSKAMNVREALYDRLPVEKRNDVISLSDAVLGGMSYANPKVLSLMAGRKLLKNPLSASNLAQYLYGFSKAPTPYEEQFVNRTVSPVIKSMISEYARG